MTQLVPTGTAVYVQKIEPDRMGTPAQLAKRFHDHGMSWCAIAGPWHELNDEDGKMRTGMINSPEAIRPYAEALAAVGVRPFVWGYPWIGHHELFADQLRACAGNFLDVLLDPEKGAQPEKRSSGPSKDHADQEAAALVHMLRDRGIRCIGLSTFGTGVRMRWFPLRAYLRAGIDFAGGQTYTDDGVIDGSISDFVGAVRELGLSTPVIPNSGSYKKVIRGGRRVAIPKTPEEFFSHLCEFIDDGEPVHGMITWAENFMHGAGLWREFARFSDLMKRGAGALPALRAAG